MILYTALLRKYYEKSKKLLYTTIINIERFMDRRWIFCRFSVTSCIVTPNKTKKTLRTYLLTDRTIVSKDFN